MRSRVLVVAEERHAPSPLVGPLTSYGHDVRTANDMNGVMENVRAWPPSLVVADLDAWRDTGADLCRRMWQRANIPTIVISGDPDSRSEIAALEAGAEDYILKPCSDERLLARVHVALRRNTQPRDEPALGVGEFQIDFDDRRVSVHGQLVRLTPKEFDLFVFMARRPNRVLPHRTLLTAVWGEGAELRSEYLRVFVGQLRRKLEADPSNPKYLVTEPWVGYRFNPTGLVQ